MGKKNGGMYLIIRYYAVLYNILPVAVSATL